MMLRTKCWPSSQIPTQAQRQDFNTAQLLFHPIPATTVTITMTPDTVIFLILFPPTSVLLPSILGWFFSSLCFGEAPRTLLFSIDYSSCAEIHHKVLLWFLYIPQLMDL